MFNIENENWHFSRLIIFSGFIFYFSVNYVYKKKKNKTKQERIFKLETFYKFHRFADLTAVVR